MSIKRLATDHDFYRQALALRYQLFFEKYDLPKSIVLDELESDSEHFGMIEENDLFAYGRLTEIAFEQYKISQVVVQPSLQRKGYGKVLLNAIIDVAKNAGAKKIELNAQVSAVAFYEGLGFEETGNTYPSKTTGLAHLKMVLWSVT